MDEPTTTTTQLKKSDSKLSYRKNVVPITSISDLGSLVGEIQCQLSILIAKLESDTSPEFKALMEGYVNKANKNEELKVNLEDISFKYEALKGEVDQLRETNRTLIQELQNTRDILRKIELEFNSYQDLAKQTEDNYKSKIKEFTKQNIEYTDKIKTLETKIGELEENQDKTREEYSKEIFNYKKNEQELVIENGNLKKQLEEYEILLNEQREQLDFKTKEAEYKDALLNQLIKKTTSDKLLNSGKAEEQLKETNPKKKKGWLF